MEKILEYKGFEGHIILFCKQHYKIKKCLIESLKMIWAIRCGYNYNDSTFDVQMYIMNALYKILFPTIENHLKFQEDLHRYIISYSDITYEKKIIYFYCSKISKIKIKEKINGKYKTLVKLPKPKKQIFNRILNGNGKYDDYYLIEDKN